MSRMLGFGAAILGLLLFLPDHAESQNKDQRNKNSNVTPATPDDYKTLLRNKEITGIIASADSKVLSFRLDSPHMQPGAGRPYSKRRPGGGQIMHDYKEFDLSVADNVVVKKLYLNPDYDEKGNYKFNEAAQKELRAKGYISSNINDIKPGNIAKIVVAAAKNEDKEEGVGNVTRPVVKTIYLVKEGTPLEPSKGPEKKKKG